MPQTRAVVIGCNYRGTENALKGCIPDALNMKQMIQSHLGFISDWVRLLTDDGPEIATRQNIIDAIEWLVDGAKAGDSIWLSYSGHGSNILDTNGDEADGRDEVLVPLDHEGKAANMIPDDLLFSILSRLPSGCKCTVVMDCCHSETILDLRDNVYKVRGSKAPYRYKLQRNDRCQSTAADIVLISGCKDTSYSYDVVVDGKPTGALTYALLEALREYNYDAEIGTVFRRTRQILTRKKLSKQVLQLSFGREVDLTSKFVL